MDKLKDGVVEEPRTPEYTFDIDKMDLSARLADLHQEGNYLVGQTDKGIRFRQHIPQGKILNKVNDKYVLEDMGIAQ